MGVEKTLLSKMLVPGTHRRVYAIDRHVGLSMAGLVADGRQLVNRAREEALNYKKNYGCVIPPHLLAERMGQFVHYYTLYGSIRPFGTAVMLAGYDQDTKKASLYMVEPSGVTYVRLQSAEGAAFAFFGHLLCSRREANVVVTFAELSRLCARQGSAVSQDRN